MTILGFYTVDMSKAHSRAGKFCKVAEKLYRYSSNGIHYAVFRGKGKLKWKSLKTPDRALAKRRLPTEIDKNRKIDPKAAKLTVEGLLQIYEANLKALDTKTSDFRPRSNLLEHVTLSSGRSAIQAGFASTVSRPAT